MEILGSKALVTGGGGGLGQKISLALAEAGADVAITYAANSANAEETCRAIDALGRNSRSVEMDVRDAQSVSDAVDHVRNIFGGIDIVINNAGKTRITPDGQTEPVTAPYGDIEALTPEIWDGLMAINMRGPFLVARAAAPYLKKSRRGRIVNIGSTIGFSPMESGYPFAMSKAGAVPLTRYLAATLAPDVLVNCVAPGLMLGTGLTRGASEEYIQGWRDRAVLKTTTSLDDVAQQVLQFCRSDTVTGQTIVIDGGVSFH